jgi:hypothetical protein
MKNNCSFIVNTLNKALTGTIFFSKYNISCLNVQSCNLVQSCNKDIGKIIVYIINKNWILNNIIKSHQNNKYHHHLPFFKKTNIIKHLRRFS